MQSNRVEIDSPNKWYSEIKDVTILISDETDFRIK